MIPNGRAVINNGRNATVNITMRFLKTSAHSLRTIVPILFILGTFYKLQINLFQRMAQLTNKLNIRPSLD